VTAVLSLETERLLLRPLRRDDVDELAALHAEPSFWWYPLRRGQTRGETEAFLDRVIEGHARLGLGLQAVVEQHTDALIGWAGLSVPSFLPEILPAVEVGWRLGSPWRGLGYATEAGRAWVRWGFETRNLERIVSIFEPANVASGRVMAKLGFDLERTTSYPDSQIPLHVTVLTRTRWLQLCDAGKSF
jgi:RimJ/RimL family protein N-acetyltransferase